MQEDAEEEEDIDIVETEEEELGRDDDSFMMGETLAIFQQEAEAP